MTRRSGRAAGRGVDPSPVIDREATDLRVSLTTIIHWADSRQVRLRVMTEVGFPGGDLGMFLVVNQLTYTGAMRPTDLGKVLGMTKANVSKIANRLEDADLAVRVRSPDDERSVLLALTPAGRAIGRRILRLAQHQIDAVLADWPDEDVVTLRRLVARLSHDIVRVRPT